jgi:hypothetical protein
MARIQVDSGSSLITGSIERVRDDTVFLMSKSATSQAVPLRRITRVYIRDSLSTHARLRLTRYAVVSGMLLGGAIGYAIGVPAARHSERYGGGAPFEGTELIADPIIGVLAGALIGAVTGSVWPDHWVARYP